MAVTHGGGSGLKVDQDVAGGTEFGLGGDLSGKGTDAGQEAGLSETSLESHAQGDVALNQLRPGAGTQVTEGQAEWHGL